MKNSTKIIIAVAVVLLIAIVIAVAVVNSKPKTKLAEINKAEDLSALVDKIYEGVNKDVIPSSLQTQVVDTTDNATVKYTTGLDNAENIEFAVVSEPMMTSQAYSLILVKVKNGANANEVAKAMSEGVDTRKWICVSAEQLYATNSGDVVCLVMSNTETAKAVYESFEKLAGTVGTKHEKSEGEIELPPEMY